MTTDASRTAGRRRGFPLWIRAAAVIIAIAAIGGVILYEMSWMTPAEYKPLSKKDDRVIALGERVEYRVVEEAQKLREPDDTWTLRVRQDQVNAWLATRLEQWVAHEQNITWPDEVRRPHVLFIDDGVKLLFELHLPNGDKGRVVSIHVAPSVDEQGLRLPIEGLALGMIPLTGAPIDRVADLIDQFAPRAGIDHDALQFALGVIAGDRVLAPEIDLADGRRVRLMSMACRDGMLDLTFRTMR